MNGLAINASLLDWLLRTTWQSAVLVAMVILLQKVFAKQLSPRWRQAMWLIVLFRLTVPLQFPVQVLPSVTAGREVVESEELQTKTTGLQVRTELYPLAPVPPAAGASSTDGKAMPATVIASVHPAIALWMAVAVFLVAAVVVQHVRFAIALWRPKAEFSVEERMAAEVLSRLTSRRVRVRVTRLVSTPAVFGAIRPIIVLPAGCVAFLSGSQLRLVLLHELTHLRRFDPQIELLARIACAMHWFNPAAWLTAHRLRLERESACDEVVLRQTPADERIDYGHLLLTFAGLKVPAIPGVAVRMASSSGHLRRRITDISTFDPASRKTWHRLLACGLFVGITALAVTDARSADPMPAPPPNDVTLDSRSAPQSEDPKSRETRTKLEVRSAEFDVQSMGLEAAFDRFEKASGIDVFVHWRGLEQADVHREDVVSLRLRNASYGKVLSTLLESITSKEPLAWTIDEGVVTVTTANNVAMSDLSTRTYDIRDLLFVVPDFEVPKPLEEDAQVKALTARLAQIDLSKEMAGQKFGPMHADVIAMQAARDATVRQLQKRQDALGAAATQPVNPAPSRQQMVDQLVSLVSDTIAPNSWKTKGGKLGTIRELGGQLVVTQTSDNHRQIADLLTVLRKQRSLQISVEARFILIDPAKLPEGVWRSRIEEATANAKGKAASDSWTMTPQQATDLLAQIKAMSDDSVVASPRLTIFNGQRAAVMVSNSQRYVASWRPAAAGGKSGWEPVFGTVEPGLRLELQGTCTADRRSVVLTVQPQISTLLRFDSEPFKSAGTDSDPTGQPLLIQRPVVRQQSIQTTVTVPDGQTIALCGLAVPTGTDPTGAATQPEGKSGPAVMLMLLNPTVIVQREVQQADK